MEKTVVELFAGVGGFRVGLNDIKDFDKNGKAIENNDWKFIWANQWEPSTRVQHAYDCYRTRFGDAPSHSNDDISKVNKSKIPDHSLLVGGFPCQDYSVARSLSGEKGIEGKKGVLFWEIAEILKKKKTPFVLLENVDRLLKSPAKQRGRDFGIMLRTFHDLGYNVEWRVINAADYGCAQRRRRVFIFAWKRKLKYNKQLLTSTPEEILYEAGLFANSFPVEPCKHLSSIDLHSFKDTVTITNDFKGLFENSGLMINGIVSTNKRTPIYQKPIALKKIRENKNDLSKYFLTPAQNDKFIIAKGSKKIPRIKPNGESYFYSEGSMSYPDNINLPGRTMLTSEASINRSTHIIEDRYSKKLRFLTPIEAERLQSFPDDWTDTGMPEKKRYFMMGNALVTDIVRKLENDLSRIISNS